MLIERRLSFLSILTVLSLLTFFFAYTEASDATSLWLEPSSQQVPEGSTFDLDVMIDTEGESVNGITIGLSFEPTYLSVANEPPFVQGPFLGGTVLQNEVSGNELTYTEVKLSGGSSGTGKLATVSFTALKEGATTVSFLPYPKTAISYEGTPGTKPADSTEDATITIVVEPDIDVSPSSWDYGDVCLGDCAEKTFVVSNEGDATLNVTSTTILGSSDFDIISGEAPFSLAPGETHDIVMQFCPTSEGEKNAKLRIESNDPDENPFDVPLQGNGIAPDIAVNPTSWDYGDVCLGDYAEKTFVVSNEGDCQLDVSSTTILDSGEFSITSGGEAFSLAPGETHDIVVQFCPTSEGEKNAKLRIENNDPDENPLDVTLAGNGILCKVTLSLPSLVVPALIGDPVEAPLTVEGGYTNEDLIDVIKMTIAYDSTVVDIENVDTDIQMHLDRFGITNGWFTFALIRSDLVPPEHPELDKQLVIQSLNTDPNTFPALGEPADGFPEDLLTIKFIIQSDNPQDKTLLFFIDDLHSFFEKRDGTKLPVDPIHGEIALTELEPPTVTNVTPSSRGQGATGQDIVVTGKNFVNGAVVSFSGEGITVKETTFGSDTELTANIDIADDATVSVRDVIVTNPDSQTGTGEDMFGVNTAPTVESANPSSLPQDSENQPVIIEGSGFVDNLPDDPNGDQLDADFGDGITVHSVTFLSSTELIAKISIAEDAAVGVRDVTVVNGDAGVGIGDDIFTVVPSCPFTVISKEPVALKNLRQFRDNLLAKNETGQKLIKLYYQHSPEVALILLKHPMLSIRSAVILKDVMPGIRFLLRDERGRDMIMAPRLVARIKELFFDISKEGSEELVQTLKMLSNWLEEYEGMRISRIWQAMGKNQPKEFALLQNHPNPFNPDTWIPYQLSESSYVWIRIYNVSGQLVRTLRLGIKPAGFYLTKDKAAYWDGKDSLGQSVASGVYFYTLQVREAIQSNGAGKFTATRKMVILK